MSDTPEWARERARKLAMDEGGSWPTITAFARYIAKHEQPPRDKLLEVADRLVQSYDGLHMDWMAEAMADAMRKVLPAAAIKAIEEMRDD